MTDLHDMPMEELWDRIEIETGGRITVSHARIGYMATLDTLGASEEGGSYAGTPRGALMMLAKLVNVPGANETVSQRRERLRREARHD